MQIEAATVRTVCLIVLGSMFLWLLATALHSTILPFTSYVSGIDWLYLPSGVRVAILMAGGIWAAIGVTLASLFVSHGIYGFQTHLTTILIAVAAGFAPYISLRVTLALLKIDSNLKLLRSTHLPAICVGTAIGSSVLHNAVFCATEVHGCDLLLLHTSAMALGDFTGSLAVLLLAQAALTLYRRRTRPP